MSLFTGPEEHAANPPESWEVVKRAERCWSIVTRVGAVLDTYPTRRDAVDARESGPAARLYEQERRWYAGERLANWRPWADVKRENEAREARRTPALASTTRKDAYDFGAG